MKKRYHLKEREPRTLDMKDYEKLLDVIRQPEQPEQPERPSLWQRLINWLFGRKGN